MKINELSDKIFNENNNRYVSQIVFETPDGKIFTNCEIRWVKQGVLEFCKIKLAENIKPKFKVGDIVCNNSGLHPNVKCTIAEVNEELQYYGYKEVNGRTYFKDQDKLKLVESDNSIIPVEGNFQPASTVKINSNIISVETLRTNRFIYDKYTLFVQEMMCAIKIAASKGHNELHFDIGERDINVFQLGQDFTNAGYKVSAVIENDKNSTLDIKW